MDTNAVSRTTQPESETDHNEIALSQYWNEADFKGKNLCRLKANGDLELKGGKHHPARVIANLTIDNAEILIKTLIDKFEEVRGRVEEIRKEWENTEDKLRLAGKVFRIRDYLLHTNAIGDFENLLDDAENWQREVDVLMAANYEEKLKIVVEVEKLAQETKPDKEAAQTLKSLCDSWKELGFVDKSRNEPLWNRLESARTLFFERKRERQHEIERELLQNLDLKMELVEKAEALAHSEDWKKATEAFRNLMQDWKNTGRTVHDKNEELWEKFIEAKNTFYERKKNHFYEIQKEQEANYEIKLKLVEKAEEIQGRTDWQVTAGIYRDLTEDWKNTGRVPIEFADELWNRFQKAKDYFFENKRREREAFKITLSDNLVQKQALLKRAEEIMDSSAWRETTREMNELLTEWKNIGPVPRAYSDDIWQRFRQARRHFFRRKDENREKRKKQIEHQRLERIQKTGDFLYQIEMELKEESEKLVDFQEALENVTSGKKEDELREHLAELIRQCEQRIVHKQQKIREVKEQAEALLKTVHPEKPSDGDSTSDEEV